MSADGPPRMSLISSIDVHSLQLILHWSRQRTDVLVEEATRYASIVKSYELSLHISLFILRLGARPPWPSLI